MSDVALLRQPLEPLLTLDTLPAAVARHVAEVKAIDVHTHLLPPSHGAGKDALLLFGIDELLTYHYLVAEMFMVLPLDSPLDSVSRPGDAPTPDEFFAWPKAQQAELVFEELFVKRTPLSEACRGVVTVLQLASTYLACYRPLRDAKAGGA